MATTLLQHLISFLKGNAPGVLTASGSPGNPDIGETDWSGVTATGAALDEYANVTDGQILIGMTGTAGLSNPTTAPTLAAGTGGSLAAGTYEVVYTYINSYGETTASSAGSITFASGTTNKINVSALTVPGGVTSVKWYMSDAPGSITLRYSATNSGGAFSITALPVGGSPIPPTSNTTGLSNHPVKGQISGSNGVGITNGAGTIDAHLDVTGDISVVAGAVTVEAVQGTAFSATGPTNDQIPRYNSTSGEAEWQDAITNLPASPTQKGIGFLSVVAADPANPIFVGDNDPRFTAGIPLTSGHILVGNVSNAANDIAMSGDATIAVSGAVTVGKINGVALTGTPSTGKIPVATSSSAATWQTPTIPASGVTAGSYTATNITVGTDGRITAASNGTASSNATQLQSIPVQSGTPTDQTILRYNATANQWQSSLESTFVFFGARGNVTVSKTLTNNTFTKIAFDGTDFDQTGFWISAAPTKLTAPSGAAGFYLLTGSVRFTNVSTGGTGNKQINIRVNNVDVVLNNVPTVDAGNGWSLTASTVFHLAAGDYVELVAYQNTGVTMNAGDAAGNASLSIARLGT